MTLSVKCKQARKPEFDLRNHVRKKILQGWRSDMEGLGNVGDRAT